MALEFPETDEFGDYLRALRGHTVRRKTIYAPANAVRVRDDAQQGTWITATAVSNAMNVSAHP